MKILLVVSLLFLASCASGERTPSCSPEGSTACPAVELKPYQPEPPIMPLMGPGF